MSLFGLAVPDQNRAIAPEFGGVRIALETNQPFIKISPHPLKVQQPFEYLPPTLPGDAQAMLFERLCSFSPTLYRMPATTASPIQSATTLMIGRAESSPHGSQWLPT